MFSCLLITCPGTFEQKKRPKLSVRETSPLFIRVLLIVPRAVMLPTRPPGLRIARLLHLPTERRGAPSVRTRGIVFRRVLLQVRAAVVAAGAGGGRHARTLR